jgi:hypothetical protein
LDHRQSEARQRAVGSDGSRIQRRRPDLKGAPWKAKGDAEKAVKDAVDRPPAAEETCVAFPENSPRIKSPATGLDWDQNMVETTVPIKLTQPRGTTLINMAVAALIITALYLGREIFVPVALAVLLSFVLAPFVSRLQSLRLPRIAAVLAVVILGFAIIFSLGGLMVS